MSKEFLFSILLVFVSLPTLASSDIYLSILRRPRQDGRPERREDPFWEFGSFGTTGCHHRNLLSAGHREGLRGSRLAFVQAGPEGFKLIYLTPPLSVHCHSVFCEVRWDPSTMPYKYSKAPLIIANDGGTEMGEVKKYLARVNRPSWESRFASRFRSYSQPLPKSMADAIIALNSSWSRRKNVRAKDYLEALPYPPRDVDFDRRATYEFYLSEATAPPSAKCPTLISFR